MSQTLMLYLSRDNGVDPQTRPTGAVPRYYLWLRKPLLRSMPYASRFYVPNNPDGSSVGSWDYSGFNKKFPAIDLVPGQLAQVAIPIIDMEIIQ